MIMDDPPNTSKYSRVQIVHKGSSDDDVKRLWGVIPCIVCGWQSPFSNVAASEVSSYVNQPVTDRDTCLEY